ncbi:MAG: hypothetical protein DI536_12530 [Archangium gephyra]|uniref:Uncharacterized protein n=1 Tax=Archangium gephyra TaxID=48 RepID=A0A2W5UWK3_9BACT|nr:MAG: hypothetical protein DI536_12530 [Archangium gephyra]
MAQVDALFRTLSAAHPRTLQIVRRACLENLTTEQLAQLYGITPDAAQILVTRALFELGLIDEKEALVAHRTELLTRLDAAALEYARSPDRVREERLRQLAIVVVLVLSAFFYWREANKPKTVLKPRPPTPAAAP